MCSELGAAIEGAQTHKQIDTEALHIVCEASGLLYPSGDYEDSSRFFGTYLTAHTPRDDEWSRKGHDLLEYHNGGGPSRPTDPAHDVPCVGDDRSGRTSALRTGGRRIRTIAPMVASVLGDRLKPAQRICSALFMRAKLYRCTSNVAIVL